jgi:ribosomal-protein-serine acetyltransferase
MGPAETLEGGTVTLRRWDPAWAEELDEAINASLPQLKPFMPWANDAHSLANTEEYLQRSVREWDAGENWNYAIAVAGQVVGSCGLMTRMGPGVLEIGYWVHSAHSGRGIATEAARTLAAAGLQVPGIDRLVIKHDAANPASGRVAEKAGFTEVSRYEVDRDTPSGSGVEVLWERRA